MLRRLGLLLAAVASTSLTSLSPVGASTPSLLWANASRVAVSCLAQSRTTSEAAAFEAALCGRVRAAAARGAPLPVKLIQLGDREMVAPGTVVLLVHASIERAANGRTVAFTIRPYRASREDEIYFGTAPRVVGIPRAASNPALDAALGSALAELLPWQQQSGLAARPL